MLSVQRRKSSRKRNVGLPQAMARPFDHHAFVGRHPLTTAKIPSGPRARHGRPPDRYGTPSPRLPCPPGCCARKVPSFSASRVERGDQRLQRPGLQLRRKAVRIREIEGLAGRHVRRSGVQPRSRPSSSSDRCTPRPTGPSSVAGAAGHFVAGDPDRLDCLAVRDIDRRICGEDDEVAWLPGASRPTPSMPRQSAAALVLATIVSIGDMPESTISSSSPCSK